LIKKFLETDNGLVSDISGALNLEGYPEQTPEHLGDAFCDTLVAHGFIPGSCITRKGNKKYLKTSVKHKLIEKIKAALYITDKRRISFLEVAYCGYI